jgi:hypothetical protein
MQFLPPPWTQSQIIESFPAMTIFGYDPHSHSQTPVSYVDAMAPGEFGPIASKEKVPIRCNPHSGIGYSGDERDNRTVSIPFMEVIDT